MLHTTLRRLAATALLAWVTAAGAQPTSPPAADIDLLADPGAWKLAQPSSATVAGGQLRLPAMADPNDPAQPVVRAVRLSASAAWSLVARLAAVDPSATDAALGVVLLSPDGRSASVMLRPRERDLIIVRGHNGGWLEPLTPFVPVPGWDGTATTPRELAVFSSGGRLSVQVDGRPVVQAGLYDFELSAVGVRATRTRAAFDKLVLREGGRDPRLARLAGLVRAPGSAALFSDDLAAASLTDRASAAGRSLLGSIGGLFGGNRDSAAAASPAGGGWGAGWNTAATAFNRDTERKRLVLESRDADRSSWVVPGSNMAPLPLAGVAVQARLEAVQLGDGASMSVALRDTRAGNFAPDEEPSRLHLTIGASGTALWEYRRSDKQWHRLGLVPAEATGGMPRSGLLRLVHQDRSAWVFVDGRLLLQASGLAPLRPNEAGMAVDGLSRMEVSSFSFDEI